MQYTYYETKHIKYFICNRFGIREGKFCSLQERSINAGTLTVNYEKVKEKDYYPNSNHIETNIVQFKSLIHLYLSKVPNPVVHPRSLSGMNHIIHSCFVQTQIAKTFILTNHVL